MSQVIDEDLTVIKTEFLNLKKELHEVTYQLVSLYDRWAVEHQQVARREAEMTRIIESFDNEVKRLSKLDTHIQHNIQTTISKAAILVGEAVGKETKKLFEPEFSDIARRLEWTVEKAESMARRFERAEETASAKIWAIVILSSLLVGVLMGKFL